MSQVQPERMPHEPGNAPPPDAVSNLQRIGREGRFVQLGLLFAGWACIWLIGTSAEFSPLLMLLLGLGVIAIGWFRTAIGVQVLMLVLLYVQLVTRREDAFSQLQLTDAIVALLMLVLLSICFRLIDLRQGWGQWRRRPESGQRPVAVSNWQQFLLRGWGSVALALLISVWIIRTIPLDVEMPYKIGLTPAAGQVLQIGWLLFFLWVIAYSIVAFLRHRQLTYRQAAIYLRSSYVAEMQRELTAIGRRRKKYRLHKLKQNS